MQSSQIASLIKNENKSAAIHHSIIKMVKKPTTMHVPEPLT